MACARRRCRLLLATGIVLAGAVACSSSGSTPDASPTQRATTPSPSAALAAQRPVVAGSGYLALGDSVPFGYREPNSLPGIPHYDRPSTLVGYPEDVATALHLHVVNATCPGETTASFFDTRAQSNGCTNSVHSTVSYRAMFPLHVKYAGPQAAFAVRYLKAHPGTRLVTLMIGANDGFVCQETTKDGCTSELTSVLGAVQRNVTRILSLIRDKAHYAGQLVLVSYYSTDYSSNLVTFASTALNAALQRAAQGFDVRVADGFGVIKRAARTAHGNTCTARLLTRTPSGTSPCGVHPSARGQALLAKAVEHAITR